MSVNSNERIRAYLGESKLTLSKDGRSEDFIVKSIRIADLGKILSAVSNDSKEGNVSPEDTSKLMFALHSVGVDMLKRSFIELSDDEIESLLVKNFKQIMECIMNQVKIVTPETKMMNKLKEEKEHKKDEVV